MKQYQNRGYYEMNPPEIRTAELAFAKYRTRNPFELMEARNILLKLYTQPEGLLGFYTVMNRRQVIGLNETAEPKLMKSGAVHELGHSLNDYRLASAGKHFSDYKFYSLSSAPTEFSANITGADLLIDDDELLEKICYQAYQDTVEEIERHIGRYRSAAAKVAYEQDRMQEFYQFHEDIPSYEDLAREYGVVEGVIHFKFRALAMKGYELPNLPDTQADFLQNWR